MKSIHLLGVILSLLITTHCKDEERESRKRGQDQFLFSIAMAGFFKPNFCSAPELLLEEGKVYNITLEAGKRFWFDYAIRSTGGTRNYQLTVNKDADASIQYQLKACNLSNDLGERKITSSTPTQIIYENEPFSYTNPSSSNANSKFFLESKSGNTMISIFFNQL